MSTEPRRVVPLEAGASPENPPCPACGEPLFGWLAQVDRLDGPVRRCESCGLGVVGASGGTEDALAALAGVGREDGARFEDRSSWACSLGGAGWSALRPGTHYFFTEESARRLVATRDQVVAGRRWLPMASFAATWQTLLNSLTFGHDVALAGLGRGVGAPATEPWQRGVDRIVSVLGALPAALVALPVELAAGAMRRGAVVALRFELV